MIICWTWHRKGVKNINSWCPHSTYGQFQDSPQGPGRGPILPKELYFLLSHNFILQTAIWMWDMSLMSWFSLSPREYMSQGLVQLFFVKRKGHSSDRQSFIIGCYLILFHRGLAGEDLRPEILCVLEERSVLPLLNFCQNTSLEIESKTHGLERSMVRRITLIWSLELLTDLAWHQKVWRLNGAPLNWILPLQDSTIYNLVSAHGEQGMSMKRRR